jgi:hypothetical protein
VTYRNTDFTSIELNVIAAFGSTFDLVKAIEALSARIEADKARIRELTEQLNRSVRQFTENSIHGYKRLVEAVPERVPGRLDAFERPYFHPQVEYVESANYFYFWAFETPWVLRVWFKTLTGYLLVSMHIKLRIIIRFGPKPRHPKAAGFLSLEEGILGLLIDL